MAALTLSLSSCTVPTSTWVYQGHNSDLRLALCTSVDATAIRIVVAKSDDSLLQSVVWSGPRVLVAEGAAVVAGDLPAEWETTTQLDLDAEWDYLDYSVYDGEEYVEGDTLRLRDFRAGVWSLFPAPTFWSSSSSCDQPYEGTFPSHVPPGTSDFLSLVERTEAMSMPESEFWALIAAVGPDYTETALEQLRVDLSTLPAASIAGFQAQLLLQFNALDRAAVWDMSEVNMTRSSTSTTWISTSDRFLEFRSSIILGGPELVESVLEGNQPPNVLASANFGSLRVAATAAAARAGLAGESTAVPLPIAMGANQDGW